MTIKEFLQAGGQIDPKFQLIDKCEDSYTKNDAGDIPDDATSDDLVQHSFDHDRYTDEQVFDEKNEYFTITAPDGTVLANWVTKDISDQIIDQYTDSKSTEVLSGGTIIENDQLVIGDHEFFCDDLLGEAMKPQYVPAYNANTGKISKVLTLTVRDYNINKYYRVKCVIWYELNNKNQYKATQIWTTE